MTVWVECPICFGTKSCVTLLPCRHHVCPQCFHKQLYRDYKCAICRQILFDCMPPLVDCNQSTHIKKILINRELNAPVGVTVTTNENGVVIKHVEEESLAKDLGMKPGNLIIAFNSIPCYNHASCVEMMKSSTQFTLYVVNNALYAMKRI